MNSFREKVKVIIFGTDTKGGKIFDIVLIVTIVLSIITAVSYTHLTLPTKA